MCLWFQNSPFALNIQSWLCVCINVYQFNFIFNQVSMIFFIVHIYSKPFCIGFKFLNDSTCICLEGWCACTRFWDLNYINSTLLKKYEILSIEVLPLSIKSQSHGHCEMVKAKTWKIPQSQLSWQQISLMCMIVWFFSPQKIRNFTKSFPDVSCKLTHGSFYDIYSFIPLLYC